MKPSRVPAWMLEAVFSCAALAAITGCADSLVRLPGTAFEFRPALPTADVPAAPFRMVPVLAAPVPTEPALSSADRIRPAALDNPVEERVTIDAVDAPLDALLYALASEVDLQLRQNGTLDSRVTLRLKNGTLSEALSQLSAQSDFAWELTGQHLTIWIGEPFAASYAVDYLNMDRRTDSSVGLATQVGTINASISDSGSVANSSQARIENTAVHHLWDSLSTDLDRLVSRDEPDAQFTLNREAGLLNLYARPAVHRSIKQYLVRLHDSIRRQVLIEATVVEIALSDSFEAGVDWQMLARGVNGLSAVQALTGAPLVAPDTIDRVVPPAGLVSLVQQGSRGDIRATLSLLEQFGDVRILSRPRIIALNNQSSVLKVVDNRVYFTVNIERRQSETRDEIVTESEIHTVPVGLVMNVTPQISSSGAVMLNVRPTLSRILGFVNDPNPELAEANVRNGVPEIQVREMESMLQVQSGSMAIIGGLMQETVENSDNRLPGLGTLPLLKNLFSQRARRHRQTELLIVLRPTVIEPPVQVVEAR